MTNASIAALVNRDVSVEEVRRALDDPIPNDERDDIHALHRWFVERYPTGEARLAYVRQAYARWILTAGAAAPDLGPVSSQQRNADDD